MFDMMPMLRNRNIFSGGQPQPERTPFNNVLFDGQTDDDTNSDGTPKGSVVTDRPNNNDRNPFEDGYTRVMNQQPGPASQRFNQVLAEAPKREDFEPNKKQRLASILTGIAAGSQGKDGYGAAQRVLDDPFNEAQADFNNKAGYAKLAADEEEKNVTNRRQIYRDIMADQDRQRREATQDKLANSTIDLNTARAGNLRGPKAPQSGWLDKTDGHRKMIQADPSTPQGYRILDMGKADETPAEQDNRLVTRFGRTAGITLSNQKQLFNFEEPQRQTNRIAAQDHENELTMKRQTARMDRQEAERVAADANNPNRQYARRTMAYIDVMDEHPELASKIQKNSETGVWETDDPQVRDFVNAKLRSNTTAKPSSRIVK